MLKVQNPLKFTFFGTIFVAIISHTCKYKLFSEVMMSKQNSRWSFQSFHKIELTIMSKLTLRETINC